MEETIVATCQKATSNLCNYCSLKGEMCTCLKEIMKIQLKNTGVDGSKLCPLLIASIGGEQWKEPK